MTLKNLGIIAGIPARTADIRIAQYECGTRKPKPGLTRVLAEALDVSSYALSVPEIDSIDKLMHLLFLIEDLFGLKLTLSKDGILVQADDTHIDSTAFIRACNHWCAQSENMHSGKLSKEEYDTWRYQYGSNQKEDE